MRDDQGQELAALAFAVAERPGARPAALLSTPALEAKEVLHVVHASVRERLLPVLSQLHQVLELLLKQRVFLRSALVFKRS